MDAHSLSETKILSALRTDKAKGLSSAEAAKRLKAHGKNQLLGKKKKSILVTFFEQFKDFMVLILLAAAAISFATAFLSGEGDFIDPIMILVIVVLNAIVGTVQERKAEHAIDALKKLTAPHAKVIRNGKPTTILSEELVVGDILLVESGDMIGADARLLDSTALKAEESALTGESVPSDKVHDITLSKDTPLADRKNMLYSSTFVTSGHAVAVVTATGMDTQVGKIASMLEEVESPPTPLQKSLASTGKWLGISALLICVVIFVLGLIQQTPPLEMFMIAISLAVAAIPEGLPAIVTIVLALGVRKMALHRAIVRHLPAVEALGGASVICSDKTGTLTQNKMTVTGIYSANGKVNEHSAEGKAIFEWASLCCNGTVKKKNNLYTADGEPTESAILTAAANAGYIKDNLQKIYPRIGENPFDSKRKRMSTLHRMPNGNIRIAVKGAPDILLSRCDLVQTSGGVVSLSPTLRQKITALNNQLASNAMRVIAVAYKDSGSMPTTADNAESGLVFCGLIAMCDPPRPQAKRAVACCQKAGIRPVMITGDHIITAKAIAKDLGIYREGDKAITGAELDKISKRDLEKDIFSYSVFARVSPEHKMRIVKAFQSHGCVTAMTGDGVNDAPALRCADIGCAMGQSGTDVAKNASDIILTDDNFSTIVEAVEQGRGIFDNIRRTIHFLLSSNIGEILTVLTAYLMKLPSPLLALQLLWVNLVTDSLPALALGSEAPDKEIMTRKPEKGTHQLFNKQSILNIIIEGGFIGALAFLAFTVGRVFYDHGGTPVTGRTMTFAVLSISQLVHSFNLRSEKSLFKTGIFGNMKLIGAFIIGLIMQVSVISIPSLATVFKTIPLTGGQWLIVAGLSLFPLIVVEVEKHFNNKNSIQ